MARREQVRLLVLNTLNRGDLKMADAARLLGLSVRQVRRLRSELRLAGVRDRDGANAFLAEFLPRYNARFASSQRGNGPVVPPGVMVH